MIYIASPFFNEEELQNVKDIEQACDKLGIQYFSPRLHGVDISKVPRAKQPEVAQVIFYHNGGAIEALQPARDDFLLMVIDNRDPGTHWEGGYAYRAGKPVVTYSPRRYGVNLMIREMAVAHLSGLLQLKTFLHNWKHCGLSEAIGAYQNYEEYREEE